ncbi:MAG TPA: Nramp family divalent metal transporter [Candidatus Limnocylindria bacterium]|nr:Nramp family divalent metal transporter [Candidatus Limnocylindria bacterium]
MKETPPLQIAVDSPSGAWRQESAQKSLAEVHGTIAVPKNFSFWRKLLAFSGPGYLVAVGYMDPGNWATDLAGGSQFGYSLLSVILISNLMAILLQALCAKLGIVTGRDLAQACRDHYSKPVTVVLWLLCEVAICACDLAEVIGSAIALNLLFKIPLVWGVCLTALDVLAVMYLQNRGFRYIEALVVTLILTIGGCFLAEIIFSRPDVIAVLGGFVPKFEVIRNPAMLYVAIGILGATVMPHNLYLHSSIVQTRKYEPTSEGRREAIKFATIDSTLALMFALFINAAILIVAAATFHGTEHNVAEIQDAHKLLSPMLGVGLASTLFAVALLASGQNSTLTGTLAGQIVMEGFLNLRLRPWLRRLITRLLAIVPAVIVTVLYGEKGTNDLLVFSQVVLSLQLSFAVIPLIIFTSSRKKMGEFVNPMWIKVLAWLTAAIIVSLNVKYLFDMAVGWLK